MCPATLFCVHKQFALVEVGLYATDAPDGKNGHVHKNAVGGFSYYVSIFKVGDEFFSGVVNVMNGKKGRLFKDVTQIKSLQLTTAGSSEPLALASFVKQALSKVIVAHQFSEVKQNSARDQTTTPEFKRWFGDSKVVDEDGKPKIMYHGTPYGGFTVFRDWQYFSDSKEYADRYQSPSASSIRGRYPAATQPTTYR